MMRRQFSSTQIRQSFRYLAVGFSTTAIYFSLIYVFREILGFRDLLSISIAYFLATIFNLLANKLFTFSFRGMPDFALIIRYGTLALVNYLLQVFVIWLSFTQFRLHFYISTLFASAAAMAIGFVVSKSWVFKEQT